MDNKSRQHGKDGSEAYDPSVGQMSAVLPKILDSGIDLDVRLANHKETLIIIARTISLARPNSFTEESVYPIEIYLREIIFTDLYDTPDEKLKEYIGVLDAVVTSLERAIQALSQMLDELKKVEGKEWKTDKFYKHLGTCKAQLKATLQKWDKPIRKR